MEFIKGKHFNFYHGYILNTNKNKNHCLHLDFYIPQIQLGIEFDGQQHFYPIEYFGGKKTFIQVCLRDKRKNIYCHKHHIHLIRIPYWDYKYISKILKEEVINNESTKYASVD